VAAHEARSPLLMRDRLLLVFADLARYGIIARPAFGSTREEGAASIMCELRARPAHAIGSWILWTESDNAAFGVDGRLFRPLILHCSAEDVVRAGLAACMREGVVAVAIDGVEGPGLRVEAVGGSG
jgi:hypothetical protein